LISFVVCLLGIEPRASAFHWAITPIPQALPSNVTSSIDLLRFSHTTMNSLLLYYLCIKTMHYTLF
jgi:hypothetical protein